MSGEVNVPLGFLSAKRPQLSAVQTIHRLVTTFQWVQGGSGSGVDDANQGNREPLELAQEYAQWMDLKGWMGSGNTTRSSRFERY